MYLPGRPGARVGAGAGVKVLEAAKVGVWVPLPLVRAPETPPASSFLPEKGRALRRAYDPAI